MPSKVGRRCLGPQWLRTAMTTTPPIIAAYSPDTELTVYVACYLSVYIFVVPALICRACGCRQGCFCFLVCFHLCESQLYNFSSQHRLRKLRFWHQPERGHHLGRLLDVHLLAQPGRPGCGAGRGAGSKGPSPPAADDRLRAVGRHAPAHLAGSGAGSAFEHSTAANDGQVLPLIRC